MTFSADWNRLNNELFSFQLFGPCFNGFSYKKKINASSFKYHLNPVSIELIRIVECIYSYFLKGFFFILLQQYSDRIYFLFDDYFHLSRQGKKVEMKILILNFFFLASLFSPLSRYHYIASWCYRILFSRLFLQFLECVKYIFHIHCNYYLYYYYWITISIIFM